MSTTLKMDAASSILSGLHNDATAGVRSGEKFAVGLVNGLVKAQNLKQLETCLIGADGVAAKTAGIISTLIAGGVGDVTSIVNSVTGFADLAMMLPDELKNCGSMDGDADRIMAWSLNLWNPVWVMWTVPNNVIKNFDNIVTKVSGVIDNIGADNFEGAGTKYAEVLILGLGAIPAGTNKDKEAALNLIKKRNLDRAKQDAHKKAIEKAGLTPKKIDSGAENLYLY